MSDNTSGGNNHPNGNNGDEYISDAPFLAWEIRALRKLLRDEARIKWLWSTLRLWAYYVSGAVTAFYVMQEQIVKLIKKVF